MPFPKTLDELKAAGYVFQSQAKCRAHVCQADIEWWQTPQQKRIPIDAMTDGGESAVVPHWGTCKDAGAFRR